VFHTKIPFGDFNAEEGREYVSKPPNGSMSLHDNNHDNDVSTVNFATSKNLSTVQSSYNETSRNTARLTAVVKTQTTDSSKDKYCTIIDV
jgi:hypothetical protein